MKNIENIRNWNIIKDTDSSVSTNEGIGSFFVDSNLDDDFTERNDDYAELLEKLETIKNMDMIKDSDNVESTNSKMGPFADDLNINDDFYMDLIKDSDKVESTNSKVGPFDDDLIINNDYYLTKADWKIYGDCIVNSCMTMVRPGGEEFFFKQGVNKRACILSCVCKKDPKQSWAPRKIVLAICCFGIVLSIVYMFAKCEAKGEKYFKKRKEQRIIKKLKVLSQDQFSDSDDSDDEEQSLKNPGKTLEKVYHVPASSMDNFKNFEYFDVH